MNDLPNNNNDTYKEGLKCLFSAYVLLVWAPFSRESFT